MNLYLPAIAFTEGKIVFSNFLPVDVSVVVKIVIFVI
jgi:hypothetical protein